MKIGTRGSKLALYQANLVKDLLLQIYPELINNIEIIVIKTTGDLIQDKNLSEIGGKGLFTKEIEQALLDKTIDIAVHSIKDIPAKLDERFCLAAILEREDPCDAYISEKYYTPYDLPKNGVVGTSSIRRQVQMKKIRPDLKFVPFRGNVTTRLEKLSNNIVDATFLAVAGLKRLGLKNKITYKMDITLMLPSACQGAIGVECLKDNTQIIEKIIKLNHEKSKIEIETERLFMQTIQGNCSTPIAALAEIIDNQIDFRVMVADIKGTEFYQARQKGNIQDNLEIASNLGEEILTNAKHLL